MILIGTTEPVMTMRYLRDEGQVYMSIGMTGRSKVPPSSVANYDSRHKQPVVEVVEWPATYRASEEKLPLIEESTCNTDREFVSSGNRGTDAPKQRLHSTMTLTLVRNDKPRKAGRSVIFNIEGRSASVAFPKSLFGANVPENVIVEGDFSEPKAPKVAETKEERKARLAALPKLTLAEKIAKREDALAKMKAKLAAGDAPTA